MDLNEISICTFNTLNLNEPGMRIYKDEDGWSQDEYRRKIAWMAQQLQTMQADVFGFQELWHARSLAAAFEAAGMDQDYDLLAPSDADGREIVCAAAVKKGLLHEAPEWIADFPEKFVLESSGEDQQTPLIKVDIRGFSRPVLHFSVKPRQNEQPIHIYVCHFKSKGPTEIAREEWYQQDIENYKKHQKGIGAAISTIRRTAEAAALRYMLTERMKDSATPVIVLGDLNDSQHSNTVNILTEQPRYLVGDSVGGGDVALYTTQTLQEYRDTRDVYYTYVHQDMRESLDHILVSQEFYDNSKERVWLFAGLIVNNDHLNVADKKSSGASDHGVVRAKFKYKPARRN